MPRITDTPKRNEYYFCVSYKILNKKDLYVSSWFTHCLFLTENSTWYTVNHVLVIIIVRYSVLYFLILKDYIGDTYLQCCFSATLGIRNKKRGVDKRTNRNSTKLGSRHVRYFKDVIKVSLFEYAFPLHTWRVSISGNC